VSVVPAAELRIWNYPMAHLTGTAMYAPTDDEVAAMRRYVEEGGVLLIDACGGSSLFNQSVTGVLARAFGQEQMRAMGAEHPILAGSAAGMDSLPKVMLRPYAEQKLGKGAGRIELMHVGKGWVIYSPLDLTTGLLGTNTWGIVGYRPGYAQSLVKNVMLWVGDGA
jgi:hypothetical protein